MGKSLTKCQPDPKPQLQGVHLTKGQPDLKSDEMSTWPKASSRGSIWPNVNLTQSSSTLGHKMSLPGGTSDQRSAWPKVWSNVNLTQSLNCKETSDQRSAWPKVIAHLATRCLCLGVYIQPEVSLIQSDQMSTWSKVVANMATRCLCLGVYIWPKVSLIQSLIKCQPDPK